MSLHTSENEVIAEIVFIEAYSLSVFLTSQYWVVFIQFIFIFYLNASPFAALW